MNKMTELLVAAENVRNKMPGFRSVPVSDEIAKENGIMAAFEIVTGEHAGHMIVLKSVTLGEDGQVMIDYNSLDKDNKDAPDTEFPNIGADVGSIVEYFMIDAAIQELRAQEACEE